MPDTIYTGVDCCHDAERPGYDIHVTPSIVWAKPGQRIPLQAVNVTRECDPGCFYWIIARGGGQLTEEFGISTTYIAVDEQEECSGSAIISLFCTGKLMDEVKVAVNQYRGKETAYFIAGQWHDGYFPGTVYEGQTITDPETYEQEVVYESKTAVIKYVPDKDYYGDSKPETSTIFVTEHECDGSLKNRTYIALRSVATEVAGGKREIVPGKYHAWGAFAYGSQEVFSTAHTFDNAKQLLLNGHFSLINRVEVPTYYTIKPTRPAFEGVTEMELYNEQLRVWQMWMDYIKRVRETLLYPGEAVDVRNPAMIEQKCCSPYLA